MEKSLWYQLRNSFIPSCLRSEEFGDCLGIAPFLTNSQGKVTFSCDGHLAGGSEKVFSGDLEADKCRGLALRQCLSMLHGLPHCFASSQSPHRKAYCHLQFTDEETEAWKGHSLSCLRPVVVGGVGM